MSPYTRFDNNSGKMFDSFWKDMVATLSLELDPQNVYAAPSDLAGLDALPEFSVFKRMSFGVRRAG